MTVSRQRVAVAHAPNKSPQRSTGHALKESDQPDRRGAEGGHHLPSSFSRTMRPPFRSTRKDDLMFHFKSPLLHQPRPKFQTHVQAHEAVTNNELWYGNKPPNLAQGFTAAETAERRTTVMEILLRAAKRADKDEVTELAEALYHLHDKLEACRPFDRCGSLACPRCTRAFQKAKVVAQEEAISEASKNRVDKQLVFVTPDSTAHDVRPGRVSQNRRQEGQPLAEGRSEIGCWRANDLWQRRLGVGDTT